jgi:hypothetical protein
VTGRHDYTPADHLQFLLSDVFDGAALHPSHLADLRKSGLTDAMIAQQKIRTVPPSMINQLAGFTVPGEVVSAYVIPYPSLDGGFLDHIRMKVFPPLTEGDGPTVKYLQPPRSSTRIFFPIASIPAVIGSDAKLLIVEGEKKSLAAVQHGHVAVGIAGISCWNTPGSRRLHPDFDRVPLMGRLVEIVPDSDWQTHPRVRAAVGALATALAAAGARPRVIVLPDEVSA